MQTKERKSFRDAGYESLANAIVEQAVNDYRIAARIVATTNPESSDPSEAYKHARAQRAICEIEAFINSKWFGTLTAIDGAVLLARLRAGAARMKA